MNDSKGPKDKNALKSELYSGDPSAPKKSDSVSPDEFEFDVAFSLLDQDEPLAREVSDLLEGRLSTFIYSRQQGRLVGRDGEQVFADVFGAKARLVVIFWRDEWGTTKWTRIEADAIRGRAFETGYDFTLLVNLDLKKPVPAWFPKNRIWADLKRLGATVLAGIIEQKVRELGGDPTPESLSQRSERMAREVAFQAERRKFREELNYDNTQRVLAEVTQVTDLLAAWADKEIGPRITVRRQGRAILLTYQDNPPICMSVTWDCPYNNKIEGARLRAEVYRGHPPWPGLIVIDEAPQIGAHRFQPDLDRRGNIVWYENEGDAQESYEMLMERIARIFMAAIEKQARERR